MEVKKESEVVEMDDSTSVNQPIEELPKDIQEKSMPCTSNFEDHSFYNVEELTEDHHHCDDLSKKEVEEEEEEVDVLECNEKNEIEISGCNDDGTDDDAYSSSFSGTVSEHENESTAQEADSMICNDTSLPLWVRKRKLTDHWRRFAQPITWRCKWIELKIKEFQNQARLYDKEVEEYYQSKRFALENLKTEELGIKALPVSSLTQKNRIKKRKKRKRVEETSDVASYTLNHNLFSYNEYRKSFADISLNDNNSRNLDKKNNKNVKEEMVFVEETPPLEFREGDAYLEQILLKIEAAKSEARNLKNRVDKVINENQSRISSANALNLQVGSEDKKPLQVVVKTEDEKPVIISEEKKPVKSASVSSHRETKPKEEEEDDETTDILLSEILASKRREGKKAIVASPDKEGPSRSVRIRKPRNLEAVKEETNNNNTKRHKVSSSSREKPKSNVTTSSRFKLPNRKRKRGKRRQGSSSAGLRKRS